MTRPLRTEADCKIYEKSCRFPVKFLKVTWEEGYKQGGFWRCLPEQILGHEELWRYPEPGDYLPYNLLNSNGQLLAAPYCLHVPHKAVGFI